MASLQSQKTSIFNINVDLGATCVIIILQKKVCALAYYEYLNIYEYNIFILGPMWFDQKKNVILGHFMPIKHLFSLLARISWNSTFIYKNFPS